MPVNDQLGIRMKTFYENIPKTKLMRRTPVAIRIDGRAFHTFTRGFKRPFDHILQSAMHETMLYLCKNIQGCVLGYTQSDEITLILVDYKTFTSDAWFDYEVQKLCSISASMATMKFNQVFTQSVYNFVNGEARRFGATDEDKKYSAALVRAGTTGAQFDARCFNIPREEVTNLLYWRQIDASRNSIQMVGQAHFSHKELDKKSCNAIQDMLMIQKGINWNDFSTCDKRGVCAIRNENGDWYVDYNIPIFKGEGREYIEKLICQEEM